MSRCLIWVCLFLACSGVARGGFDLFVAPNGNDAWSGTSRLRWGTNGPVASLQTALQRARERRGQQNGHFEKITIHLRGGEYVLKAPLLIGPADSGSDTNHPLIISAWKNEKPVFTSETRITGWKHVSSNLWQTVIPDVRSGDWYFRQLFINGERRKRARTELYLTIRGNSPEGTPAKFRFGPGDVKKEWVQQGDVEVIALLAWSDFRMYIRDVDEDSSMVTLSKAPWDSNRETNARYYIENALDELDSPGEWYLDRKRGLLSYLAMPGENPNEQKVTAPRTQELLVLAGETNKPVENIVFDGVAFRGADWTMGPEGYADPQATCLIRGAVQARWTGNVSFDRCVFSGLGGYGIDLGVGCRSNRIAQCEFFDIGAGGIRVGETKVSSEAEANCKNVIMDNHIHALGRVFASGVGILVMQSGYNYIGHNHIHDLFYTAISVGWTWDYSDSPCQGNVIEFNHLHNIGQCMLSDMGGVYTLGVQNGAVVRNNLIHDVQAFKYGGWGLYPDQASTGILFENNIAYRCSSAGFHLHFGRENVIRNNIFAMNGLTQLMRTRVEPHLSFYFTNNIVYSICSPNILGGDWSEGVFLDHNVWYDTPKPTPTPWFTARNFREWQSRGYDRNSIFADPLFVAPEQDDFRLKRNSPALRMGFKPIDMTTVGVRHAWPSDELLEPAFGNY